MTTEIKDMAVKTVMGQMTQLHPEWWIEWASQSDLADAMRLRSREMQINFLQTRASDRVLLVLQAVYILTKK